MTETGSFTHIQPSKTEIGKAGSNGFVVVDTEYKV